MSDTVETMNLVVGPEPIRLTDALGNKYVTHGPRIATTGDFVTRQSVGVGEYMLTFTCRIVIEETNASRAVDEMRQETSCRFTGAERPLLELVEVMPGGGS